MNKIFLSVDMDEWFQCRWATGSEFSLWPDLASCFKAYYNSDKPAGEIIEHTKRIISLFEKYNADATFFFTGHIANYYPELVRDVALHGFEIGSHNFEHKDYNESNRPDFIEGIRKSKKLLEKLSGHEVIGYRAPNSTIAPYMIGDLIEAGYQYDSSVTPTKPLMGKFKACANAPHNPYELSPNSFEQTGSSGLWEFPWPVFPIRNLPAGSGIMSRIAGYWYTLKAIDHTLKTGDTAYYFHPYEIAPPPRLPSKNMKIRIFLNRCGKSYFRMLEKILKRYQGNFISGRQLLKRCRQQH